MKKLCIENLIQPRDVAREFYITISEVSVITGLPYEAVTKRERVRSSKTQKHLNDLVVILDRVTPFCGSAMQAYAWYRSEPLPSFGNVTAEALMKEGRVDALEAYLGRLEAGGYA